MNEEEREFSEHVQEVIESVIGQRLVSHEIIGSCNAIAVELTFENGSTLTLGVCGSLWDEAYPICDGSDIVQNDPDKHGEDYD